MCKWCTLGRGLRARLHEGLARAIRRRWWRGCPSAALLAALGEEDFLAAETAVVRHEDVIAAKKAQHGAAKAIAKSQCVARQVANPWARQSPNGGPRRPPRAAGPVPPRPVPTRAVLPRPVPQRPLTVDPGSIGAGATRTSPVAPMPHPCDPPLVSMEAAVLARAVCLRLTPALWRHSSGSTGLVTPDRDAASGSDRDGKPGNHEPPQSAMPLCPQVA